MAKILETATFAAGCFWGVEELFRHVKGVKNTRVGYSGGRTANPTYEQVCADNTGHAESVEIEFDPKEISYAELLKIFWENHDPTTMNQQGPDKGSQYRSVIFYHTPEQKKIAESSKSDLEASGRNSDPIVTEIVEAAQFYPAEDYHQQYLEKRSASTCQI